LREAARRVLAPAPAGWDIVLIGRPATVERAFPALVDDLSSALRRLGVV
jgi:ribonuclease P protein component